MYAIRIAMKTRDALNFLSVSGFYSEPCPDDSLQYKKAVPDELASKVLLAMKWSSFNDLPVGESELTTEQARSVMAIVGDDFNAELMYCIALCR
jgi:hypothetical protein